MFEIQLMLQNTQKPIEHAPTGWSALVSLGRPTQYQAGGFEVVVDMWFIISFLKLHSGFSESRSPQGSSPDFNLLAGFVSVCFLLQFNMCQYRRVFWFDICI